VSEFKYTELLPVADLQTPYRLVSKDGFDVIDLGSRSFLRVFPETLQMITEVALRDIQHLLRPGHLQQIANILDDPEASANDRFVALDLLKNANVSAGGVLPMCQDTGTVLVAGKRGPHVITDAVDEEWISRGIFDAYQKLNLRYSQVSPMSMWEEKNTGTNLPAQIDISLNTKPGHELEYELFYIAKGGGSANKSFLFQETKALLNPKSFMEFLDEKLRMIGTSACPPYHLAIVVGGTSAEHTLKVAKYASTRALDSLPLHGGPDGNAYRDVEMEAEVLKLTQGFGIGAQFGGKYFCHDVRVIRMPRHGASCPVGIAVSCAADRQAFAKITPEGVFVEALETDPAKYLPEVIEISDDTVTHIDLNQPMQEIQAQLSALPVKSRVALTGPMIVARDSAHARLFEILDSGGELPEYFKNHPVYYAGPAKTPEGMPSGSFGPTTAGRMDTYVPRFQSLGGSLVMLAKGNRSAIVTESCKAHGGFYLGSIGGPAAILAQDNITKVEVLDFEDLGMEAVWKIEVKDFPAFIVIDDKGNDFYADTMRPVSIRLK
jgi:fumarate hydratase class I